MMDIDHDEEGSLASDYEAIAGDVLMVQMEISMARDGDQDDMLNVCQSILRLIEKLNGRLGQ
jgi:hypothetical protein